MPHMPFTSKYPHLGPTEKVRVPQALLPYVGRIVEECDRISGAHGTGRVGHILDKVIEGLENC